MIVDDFDGEVQDFVGDQIFAIFNKRGDQPDHALRGARAALELQRRAETIRASPDWPRFRCGSTPGRSSRASSARAGTASTASSATRSTSARGSRARRRRAASSSARPRCAALPEGADVRASPPLHIKGKAALVQAFTLYAL